MRFCQRSTWEKRRKAGSMRVILKSLFVLETLGFYDVDPNSCRRQNGEKGSNNDK